MELADPTGDQLGVLGAEVDHQHGFVVEGFVGHVNTLSDASDGAPAEERPIRPAWPGNAVTSPLVESWPMPPRRARILVAALVVVVVVVGAGRAAAAPAEPPPPDTVPTSENVFVPTDRDLSECFGALPQPGCGSEARGGWQQTLLLVIVTLALAFIAWRIIRSSRRRRRQQQSEELTT